MTDQPEAQPETAERRLPKTVSGLPPDLSSGTVNLTESELQQKLRAARAAGFQEGAAEGAGRYRTELEAAARARHDSGYASSQHVFHVPEPGRSTLRFHKFETCPSEDCVRVRALLARPEAREPGISVERLAAAYSNVVTRYDEARRAKSQEIWGHPGAHIASIPQPEWSEVAAEYARLATEPTDLPNPARLRSDLRAR